MPADMNLLLSEFRVKCETVLAECSHEGFDLVPFFTLRGPEVQARLWRQSRTTAEIVRAIEVLRREGAEFIAEVLDSVGPQHGRWATNALPGQSWHQWGEAVDCYLAEGERAVWGAGHPGYRRYAEIARDLGLTAGFFWKRRDAVHVQFRGATVRSIYTWSEIDASMSSRFSS